LKEIFRNPSFLPKTKLRSILDLLKTKKHRKTFDIQLWTVIIIVLDCVRSAHDFGFGGAAKFLFPFGKKNESCKAVAPDQIHKTEQLS